MDLKLGAVSYISNNIEMRYVVGNDGVTSIIDSSDHITITKNSEDIVLQKESLGNWTLHMFANVPPE